MAVMIYPLFSQNWCTLGRNFAICFKFQARQTKRHSSVTWRQTTQQKLLKAHTDFNDAEYWLKGASTTSIGVVADRKLTNPCRLKFEQWAKPDFELPAVDKFNVFPDSS